MVANGVGADTVVLPNSFLIRLQSATKASLFSFLCQKVRMMTARVDENLSDIVDARFKHVPSSWETIVLLLRLALRPLVREAVIRRSTPILWLWLYLPPEWPYTRICKWTQGKIHIYVNCSLTVPEDRENKYQIIRFVVAGESVNTWTCIKHSAHAKEK